MGNPCGNDECKLHHCYGCGEHLKLGHKSWFDTEECRGKYWQQELPIKNLAGSMDRMKAWMAEQKKKAPEMAHQQEIEHLVSIYREEF